ncbi:MAG: MaoC family dehydratase N-terminal domain-containing protein [Acidimicrobiia bacterium]|nr:MaoC family dehydratase N-terminal domain-containing protein [Acidimicrobiia bacterium]
MPIDPNAVGTKGGPWERAWTSKDTILYALGVGAGMEDPTGSELEFTTENSALVDQRVLPTFPVLFGAGYLKEIGTFNPAMLVHGEEAIELHGPIPVEGTMVAEPEVVGVYDKGKGALTVTETRLSDKASGQLLATVRASMFIRGEGGFGGERGPSGPGVELPDRAPDHAVTYTTRPDQALLYRLSGDRNPLHSDPKFAEAAGFPRPILHGLCTFGFTGRALLHTLCDSDPARFRAVSGRFSKPVFPGDTLTVKMWVDGTEAVFRTETQAGEVVLDAGRFAFD